MLLLCWFCVVAFCWAGFFVLEGFGLGVGALMPIVGRSDVQRGEITRTILPAWAGNEGWLVAAAGASFFAFRRWFDGLVSAFGWLFACIAVSLVLRAVALHARQGARARLRRFWDAAVFAGSLAPAVLLGVLFADLVRGISLDRDGSVRGGVGALFSSYALLGGLVSLLLVAFQGAVFLAMRTDGQTQRRARAAVLVIAPAATVAIVRFVELTGHVRVGRRNWVLGAAIMLLVVVSASRAVFGHYRPAFGLAVAATLLMPLWVFATMWPNLLPDRVHPLHSLTVHNAAASGGALVAVTVVGFELAALVIVYLTWSYWIFHARVSGRLEEELGAVPPRPMRREHGLARTSAPV